MAGTIPLSMTQQLDELGKPLAGGKLYIIQAGTTSTPQNAYIDSALTLLLPNPIILSASGRIPQFFLADGSIKVRLTDQHGAEKLVADGLIVTGASSGGGGGSPVDPTTVLQTGWIQPIYGTGIVSGFVRANGRTIGNASSGATERAFADTAALFTWLYSQDTNLAVSGGRGVSAAVDYAANKTIALPDWRGRGIAGLDDMGNTAAGRLTATYFGTAATVLGAAGGGESHLLTVAETPAHAHPGTTINLGSVLMNDNSPWGSGNSRIQDSGGTGHDVFRNLSDFSAGGTAPSVTIASQGGGIPHAIASPMLLATIYIKL